MEEPPSFSRAFILMLHHSQNKRCKLNQTHTKGYKMLHPLTEIGSGVPWWLFLEWACCSGISSVIHRLLFNLFRYFRWHLISFVVRSFEFGNTVLYYFFHIETCLVPLSIIHSGISLLPTALSMNIALEWTVFSQLIISDCKSLTNEQW